MLALYRAGRQAEALEAYRQARETLVDELGIEPSTDLQRLEQSILRHDSDLDLPVAAREAEVAPAEERRRTATLLFAEIVDSSRLGAILDPEVLRSVMRRYFDTVRTIVERHEGAIEKFIGDAAMAVFRRSAHARTTPFAPSELRTICARHLLPERRPRARSRARAPDQDRHQQR
jgi:class 3 adenylate cyclase